MELPAIEMLQIHLLGGWRPVEKAELFRRSPEGAGDDAARTLFFAAAKAHEADAA